MISRFGMLLSIAILLTIPVLLSCGGGGDGGPGGTTEVTPEDVQAFFEDNAATWTTGILQGHLGLLRALAGEEVDGVEIESTFPTVSGSASLDLDGDGIRETTLNGGGTFLGLIRGLLTDWNEVEYQTSSIDSPYLEGSGGGSVTRMGTNAYYIDAQYDFVWSSGPEVEVIETWLMAEDTGGGSVYLEGGMWVIAGGTEFELFFETDGLGWWTTRLEGDGWEFP